uniref:Uncharacterized protein n=1 Tax=Timema poppense TaxID=170557 RepID=A0A7R9D653_TIMPO|nr:unnamed protein product [Timema poppensis]
MSGNGTLECRIVNVAMSGHKLRKFTLTSNEHHLLSYGADGLVILHSPDSEKCIGTIMPHHRTTGGVRFAVADALNYCVITLGQDGSLIGSVFKSKMDRFVVKKRRIDSEITLRDEELAVPRPVDEADKHVTTHLSGLAHHRSPTHNKQGLNLIKNVSGSAIWDVLIMPDLLKERKLQQAASSPEINTMFTVSTTSGFYPSEKGLNKTWLDLQDDIKLMCEKMASCAERTKIKEDFVELQKKLVALLDNNYKSPPKEQLKIQDFNLDIDTRERKIAEAVKKREERRNYLISLCEAQDRLCSMLKIQFWDSMDVKGRTIKSVAMDTVVNEIVAMYIVSMETIAMETVAMKAVSMETVAMETANRAISGCCEVDNYPLLPVDPAFEERLKNVIQRRKIELIVNKDFFRPWEPTTASTIKLQLAKDPLKQDEDEAGRIKKALLAVEDSLEDEEREKVTDLHVLSGSGSYEFADPSPLGYSQYKLVTYLHLYNQNTLLKSVCQECRLWFNKQFDDMYEQKEREISMVVGKNERLRYILSELREDTTHVVDPEWTPEERPLTIMKVEEWETPKSSRGRYLAHFDLCSQSGCSPVT